MYKYLVAFTIIFNILTTMSFAEKKPYHHLPDGTFIGSRRVVASGDKSRINKLVDNFGRIIDETKETSRVSSEN